MDLIKKNSKSHRGVIGIESAIVLIAFVIVAAALAFVVLNMGFATTQKAKTSIFSTLGEVGSTMEVSGSIVGYSGGMTPLDVVVIPLKVTTGGESIDLQQSTTKISYVSDTIVYDNILEPGCVLNNAAGAPYASPADAWAVANGVCAGVAADPTTGADPTVTRAIVYWTVGDTNTFLEQGEHAVISIAWNQAPDQRPAELDKIKIEIITKIGATLTVERQIPNISTGVVKIG